MRRSANRVRQFAVEALKADYRDEDDTEAVKRYRLPRTRSANAKKQPRKGGKFAAKPPRKP